MMQDHQEVYDEMVEKAEKAQREAEAEKRREGRGVEPIVPHIQYQTPVPQKIVKKVKMAKTGGLMSASKRADGIAQRGKTRGRIV